jgi:long-chain acyl-CoA synthetase
MTVAELLARAAAQFDERVFVVDDAGARWTFGETEERARRAAAALVARGIEPGDRVALLAANSAEFVAAWLGITLAGAAVMPMSTVASPEERAEQLTRMRCKAIAAADVAELLQASPAAALPAIAGDTIAQVLLTSGTTGGARPAAVSHGSLVTHTANVARTVGLTADDVVLGALPLTHSFGSRMVMLLALATGARIVLMSHFRAARALALLDEEAVTFWPAVPTMLAAACTVDGAPPRMLRWVLSAGAPLADALCHRAEARLGCAVRQGYGLTEASFSTIDAPPAPRVVGCVGRPVAGVEVRIAADGEIEVRGPHVMAGYLDGTPAPVDDAGWLRSGDVGRLDDDGRLWIVDRKKDLIIRGGNNVYPSEIEGVLAAHPAVAEVAVVGRPDDYFGEEIVAVVVVRSGHTLTADELVDFARARLSPIKYPREIAFADALPLGPSGKVVKRALRQLLVDGTLPATKPSR